MTHQFSIELLEKFFAPGIDEFRPPELPNLNEEFPDTFWLQNHFLNSLFGNRFAGDWRPRVVIFLFRVKAAFDAYERARQACASFKAKSIEGNPASTFYFEAVAQFEMVILNLHHATDLFREFEGDSFTETSDETKIRIVANRIKHCAEDIGKGHHSSLTLPMYLTNGGVVTRVANIGFDELVESIKSFAESANDLQNPSAMAKKYKP